MAMNYRVTLKPYMPVMASGFFFADRNDEIWCFDPQQQRVFHVGAEIEMLINFENPGQNNGYFANTLREAFEEVAMAVGNEDK